MSTLIKLWASLTYLRRGPYNLGTTCFAGSILSCITSVDHFMKHIANHNVACSIDLPGPRRLCTLCNTAADFYLALLNGAMSDHGAEQALSAFYTHIFPFDLKKCHVPLEFLEHWVAKLPEECRDMFSITCITTTEPCIRCNGVRRQNDVDQRKTFFINCAVKTSCAASLTARFASSTRRVRCCDGNKNVTETYQDKIVSPPQALILELNRSEFWGAGSASVEVTVDDFVSLRPFMQDPVSTSSLTRSPSPLHYRAVAVIYLWKSGDSVHYTFHCRRRSEMSVWDYHDDNAPRYCTAVPVGVPDSSLHARDREWLERLRRKVYIVMFEAVSPPDILLEQSKTKLAQTGSVSVGPAIELSSASDSSDVQVVVAGTEGVALKRRRIHRTADSEHVDSSGLKRAFNATRNETGHTSLLLIFAVPGAIAETMPTFRILPLAGPCLDWSREASDNWPSTHVDVLSVVNANFMLATPLEKCGGLAIDGVTFLALLQPVPTDDDSESCTPMRVLVFTSNGALAVWMFPNLSLDNSANSESPLVDAAVSYATCVSNSETCPILECKFKYQDDAISGTATVGSEIVSFLTVSVLVYFHAHSTGSLSYDRSCDADGDADNACGPKYISSTGMGVVGISDSRGSACSMCSPTGGACSCPVRLT